MSKSITRNNNTAYLQGPILYQQCGYGPFGFIQFCFNDRANNRAIGIGADIGVICHKQYSLQQVIDALFLFGRNRNDHGITTPFIWGEIIFTKLFFNKFRIGIGFIDLI